MFRLLLPILLFMSLTAHVSAASWAPMATISGTSTLVTNSLCYTDGRDILCNAAGPATGLTGDRIVSGSTNITAISNTSYISLTTADTTWGYLNSTNSYLPYLNAASISSTNISVTTINGKPYTGLTSPTDVPAFLVNKNGTNQTITSSAWEKITFSNKVLDSFTNFSTSTSRFTPTVAGNYIVTGSVYCTGAATGCWVAISKNGVMIATGGSPSNGSSAPTTSIVTSMNGSTDYLELYAFNNGGTTISGGGNNTFFSGSLVASGNGAAGSGGASALSGLSDVSLAGLTTGQALTWNGSSWVNSAGSSTDRIISGTTGMYAYNNTSASIATAGVERVVIGANGNVGIGQQPQSGYAIFISNTSAYIGARNGASNGYVGASTGGFLIGSNSNHPLVMFTSGTEYMRLTESGLLGIGTSAPASALHVSGTVRATQYCDVNGNNCGLPGSGSTSGTVISGTTTMVTNFPDALLCTYTSTGALKILNYGGNNAPGGTAVSAHYYVDADSSGNRWIAFTSAGNYDAANSSLSAFDSGSNCVGKSITQLYASGQAFNFIGNSGAGGSSALGDRITSGTTGVYAYNNTSASIATAGVERMVIGTNGNVGIGSQPSNGVALYVSGTLTTNSSINNAAYTEDNAGAGYVGKKTRGTEPAPTAVLAGDRLTGLYGVGYNGTAFSGNAAAVQLLAAQTFTSTAAGSYINFETTPLNSTSRAERMRIDPVGNIGIGTTSPASPLHVSGTIRATQYCDINGANCGLPGSGGSGTSVSSTILPNFPDAIACTGASTIILYLISSNATNVYYRFIYDAGTYDIAFTLAGAYAGNTNMSGYDCVTSAKSIATLYAQGKAFNLLGGGGSSGSSATTALGDRITSGTTGMYAYNNTSASIATAGVERLTVGTNGNVGLAMQPQASQSLSVSGSTSFIGSVPGSIANFSASSANDSVQFGIYGYPNDYATTYLRDTTMLYAAQNTANLQLTATSTTGVIRFTTGDFDKLSNERMRITSDGNIGIGTISPSSTLHVSGTVRATQYCDINGANCGLPGSGGSNTIISGTTTMLSNWPDAIMCNNSAGSKVVLYVDYVPFVTNGKYYYRPSSGGPTNYMGVIFNSNGTYYGVEETSYPNCNKSISQLYTDGQAFNFIGNSGAGGSALGDRITSGTTGMYAYNNTSASIATAGVERLVVGADGKIGVGAQPSWARIGVSGSVLTYGTSGGLYIADQLNSVSNSAIYRTGNITRFYDNTGGGADRMVIDNTTGNVGIGTTTPSYTLSVNGVGEFGGLINKGRLDFVGDIDGAKWLTSMGGYAMTFFNDNSGVTAVLPNRSNITAYGRTFYPRQMFTTEGGLRLAGEVIVAASGVGCDATRLGAIKYESGQFYACKTAGGWDTLSTSGGSALGDRITSGTLAQVITQEAGTVQISATSTFINYGGTNTAALEIGNGATGSRAAHIDLTGDATYTDYGLRIIRSNTGNNAPSSILHRGTGILTIGTQEYAPIVFSTNSSEAMRLTADNRLGINTVTPTNQLTVSGSASIGGPSSGVGYVGLLQGNSSRTGYTDYYLGNGTSIGYVGYGATGTGMSVMGRAGQALTLGASATSVIYLDVGGNVGIGKSVPTAELDVAGSIQYTGTITDLSDRRLKTKITALPVASAVQQLSQLAAMQYEMKSAPGIKEWGFIAQDVEKIFPLLVHTANDPSGTKSLNYVGLIPVLVKANQELATENTTLKSRVENLEQRLERLEKTMQPGTRGKNGAQPHE